MYLATEQSENDNIKFYYDLTNQLIEEKDYTHKKLIESILISAHLFALGKITFIDIDRQIYDVVSELVKSDINKDYFMHNIQKDNITNEDFITLRNTLTSLAE